MLMRVEENVNILVVPLSDSEADELRHLSLARGVSEPTLVAQLIVEADFPRERDGSGEVADILEPIGTMLLEAATRLRQPAEGTRPAERVEGERPKREPVGIDPPRPVRKNPPAENPPEAPQAAATEPVPAPPSSHVPSWPTSSPTTKPVRPPPASKPLQPPASSRRASTTTMEAAPSRTTVPQLLARAAQRSLFVPDLLRQDTEAMLESEEAGFIREVDGHLCLTALGAAVLADGEVPAGVDPTSIVVSPPKRPKPPAGLEKAGGWL